MESTGRVWKSERGGKTPAQQIDTLRTRRANNEAVRRYVLHGRSGRPRLHPPVLGLKTDFLVASRVNLFAYPLTARFRAGQRHAAGATHPKLILSAIRLVLVLMLMLTPTEHTPNCTRGGPLWKPRATGQVRLINLFVKTQKKV